MRFRTLTMLALAAGAILGGPPARAETVLEQIPASKCAPVTSTAASMLELSNGSWVFSGSNTGTVHIICPMTTPYESWTDAGLASNSIALWRLWYRDPDGTAAGSEVSGQLFQRGPSAGVPSSVGVVLSSNGSNTATNTRIALRVDHTMQDALYYFDVMIKRSQPTQSVAFHGIDFRFPQAG